MTSTERSTVEGHPPPQNAALLTVDEAAIRLRVSKWSVYNLIRSGQLRTVKIGRRRLVSPAALVGLVELLEKEAS